MKSLVPWIMSGLAVGSAAAEVSFDGTVGGPAGGLAGPDFVIPAERGELAGSNLLHSFDRFGIGSGESATFTGPNEVSNILARVTGGEESRITGLLRSEIPDANLFLLNPAGVVIGEGAEVDVSGSFAASTADYLELRDGRRFFADGSGEVSLLTASPAAFGFFEASPAVAGEVRMSFEESGPFASLDGLRFGGESVHLIGRAVVVEDSYIKSEGGEIGLAAVGSGEARVDLDAVSGRLAEGEALGGELRLQDSALSVSGTSGGRIVLRGEEVTVAGSGRAFYLEGSQVEVFQGIDADAKGNAAGGSVLLEAGRSLQFLDGARVASVSRNGEAGGNILLRAGDEVRLRTGAQVIGSSTSSGAGGVVRVEAGGLSINGAGAGGETRLSAQSNAGGTGAGGRIEVLVDGRLELLNGGQIVTNTFGSGAAGSVLVEAGSLFMDGGDSLRATAIASVSAVPGGSGSASAYGSGGDVTVDVAGLAEIRNRATIEASTNTDAPGGQVLVRAGELRIVGAAASDLPNDFITGVVGFTALRGVNEDGSPRVGGRGGDVRVEVDGLLSLESGGQIDTSSFGSGDSGDVTVVAGVIRADRAGSDFFTGIGSDTEAYDDRDQAEPLWGGPGGDAGTVRVIARSSLTLVDGATISSSTAGSGRAGDIVVDAPQVLVSGTGSNAVYTPGPESGIVALAEGELPATEERAAIPPSTGDAGSIVVRTGDLVVTDGGKISAEALGSGMGGGVLIELGPASPGPAMAVMAPGEPGERSGVVLVRDGGRLTARSELEGDAGQVEVLGAGLITLAPSGVVESLNTGTGVAGGVRLEADEVRIEGGTISVLARSNVAGSVEVVAGRDIGLEDGLITASAGTDGGSVLLEGTGFITIDSSRIEAEAVGNGGNITIQGAKYLLVDSSVLSASAINGDGGRIDLTTTVFLENASVFDVSSQFGADGIIRIDPDVALSGNEEEGDEEPLDVSDSLQPECTAQIPSEAGSFIKAGKGGTARLPGGYLPSLKLLE